MRMQHAPRLKDRTTQKMAQNAGFGWSSSNWSGYAITRSKGTIGSVAGRWIVPKVKAGTGARYSAAWIGIDGFKNSSLIQTGTGQDYEKGRARYYAWWEILPAVETRIGLPVRPGDRMQAVIRKAGKGKWIIQLTNATRGWAFRTVRAYTGPQTSAEWVVEAPSINGRTAILANYGRTAFSGCRVNGGSPKLRQADGGVMTQNKVQISTPSAPNRLGDGFVVAYGSTVPQLPAAARKRRAGTVSKRFLPQL
jgi:hypothetical protein